jgi:hypothetical protein
MKSISQSLAALAAVALILIGSAPETQAAKVTLDGSGFYNLRPQVKYFNRGVRQTGRYRNLGGDYYHRGTIGMDWITNNSKFRSGSLSFELWAMPYYGATSGIILMTKRINPLYGTYYYISKKAYGYAISLDAYRFPELNLWEFTRTGWQWRDALTFKRKGYL